MPTRTAKSKKKDDDDYDGGSEEQTSSTGDGELDDLLSELE